MQLLWLKVLYRKAAELSAQKSRGMRRDITHEGQLWAQRGGDPNVAMTWRADVFSLLVLLQEVCWNLDLFCFVLSSSLGTASELGEWVRTAVPWGETLALQFKSFGKGVMFPSCTSSALHFSETSNTWISKSFFSHQPHLFPDHFSSFLDPLPFISCISYIPFICLIPVLNLTDVVPDFLPNLFFFTLCFQLIFPTSSFPSCYFSALTTAPHFGYEQHLLFYLVLTEQKPDLLFSNLLSGYLLLAPVLGDKYCLLFTATTVPPPEPIPMSFASDEISQEVLGSASGAVSVWIDACSSRHTPCSNNHGHLTLSWGEMCLLQLELSFRWSWETMH